MRDCDEEEECDPREYTASALCHVAGCEQPTLRAWRRRNGLFPDTMLSDGWNRFSLADMSAVKLVVDLTTIGLAAQRAVDIAMALLPIIEERSTRETVWPNGVRPTDDQRAAMMKAENAINYVVRGNSRGDYQITRYDEQFGVADLLRAEEHPTGLLVINLSNVMDISLDRLSQVRPDEIDRSGAKRAARKPAPKKALPEKALKKAKAKAPKKRRSR